jgi:hypothetical protein
MQFRSFASYFLVVVLLPLLRVLASEEPIAPSNELNNGRTNHASHLHLPLELKSIQVASV